jgi:hypothetical protein
MHEGWRLAVHEVMTAAQIIRIPIAIPIFFIAIQSFKRFKKRTQSTCPMRCSEKNEDEPFHDEPG